MLDALDAEKAFEEIQHAADQIGRGHQKGLANGAVEGSFDLTTEEGAEIEDGSKPARGLNDIAILCLGRLGTEGGKSNQNRQDMYTAFHRVVPFRGISLSVKSLRHLPNWMVTDFQ